MKKVTSEASSCFKNCKNFHKSNTAVERIGSNMHFYLHGNCIASFNYPSNVLMINDAGWQTATTKERINGILDEFNLGRIFQKNFERFYSSKDGKIEKFNGSKVFDL